ncbi:MAG: hypothetical protein EXS49_00670 [Candidatus Pacebacteria bacterium]|nr:hypothetical protein [Candidatus Paceibacterota bacterium]
MTKKCQFCKQDFIIETEDIDFYDSIKVPTPTWCSDCRMFRRFIWMNQGVLYRRKDSLTGKEIFSGIHESAPVKACDRDFWWSDAWDPMIFGKEYNSSINFFEQFKELMHSVPWVSRNVINLHNSDYTNDVAELKNSYLCFSSSRIENGAYLMMATDIKDSLDLFEAGGSELCYEGYMVDESYRVFYSINCDNSSNIWFSKDLMGCENCFSCVNLVNKSYCIWNEQKTKEEFIEFMQAFKSGSYLEISSTIKKSREFWSNFPVRFTLGFRNLNSWGEHIQDSKNVKHSFDIHSSENLKYSQMIDDGKNSYDQTLWGDNSSYIYEGVNVGGNVNNIKFSYNIWPESLDVEYSAFCHSSSNLFGCVGLRKKEYCILNKQYSKEEYSKLKEKIINEMNLNPYTDKLGIVYTYGEFFPIEFSPFGYNETMLNRFFPKSEDEAKKLGFKWLNENKKEFKTTIDFQNLADDIRDISQDILKEIIKCGSCNSAYRIVPMELEFLRQNKLPIPRSCPECRFKDRFIFVNPPKYWDKSCDCGTAETLNIYKNNNSDHFHKDLQCPNKFKTSYIPGKAKIIYCEECYRSEII